MESFGASWGTRRSWSLQRGVVAPFLLPGFIACVTYGAIAQGGFYLRQSVFLAACLLVLALAAGPGRRDLLLGWSGLTALATGLLLSAWANGWPSASALPAATFLCAAAVLPTVHALVRRDERRQLIRALSWIGAAVAVAGVVALAFHWYPWAMPAQKLWRTASTLTYANAAGCFFALVAPAALLETRKGARSGSLMLFLILLGLVTSLSRGAVAGAIVSVAVLSISEGRSLLRRSVRPGVAAAVAAAGFLPTITSQSAQPIPALVGLFAGATIACTRWKPEWSVRRSIPLMVVGVAIVAGLLTQSKLGPILTSRLTDDRAGIWKTTLDARSNVMFGSGPGTFHAIRSLGRTTLFVRYSHNDFLQAFVETGFVGIGSIALALALFAAFIYRRRPPRALKDERLIWWISLSACSAFVVHGALDFMWRMPVLVVVAFMWLAMCVTRPETSKELT